MYSDFRGSVRWVECRRKSSYKRLTWAYWLRLQHQVHFSRQVSARNISQALYSRRSPTIFIETSMSMLQNAKHVFLMFAMILWLHFEGRFSMRQPAPLIVSSLLTMGPPVRCPGHPSTHPWIKVTHILTFWTESRWLWWWLRPISILIYVFFRIRKMRNEAYTGSVSYSSDVCTVAMAFERLGN